ncbi:piggyBac transposable element-derived protein 3-like [Brienomyrus brachyistius]|uniref:piggyBac transposable element-derived protein 3-like n=1 Tax=Brienomyrus brachyistius TaxID=42636 RepID=UPI0020B2F1D6|nr:piggyBac transposable element-derived protein 3-like [Brienomyrus brachyistius]XP_048866624.1 piggyBac transposable element-derived protein 3-like [Brienomyrus brachyistius]
MARRMNGQEALQAVRKWMEESENEDSSAPEDCDTDEELCHFQDRLDPAVDDLSEDEDGSVPAASVKVDHVTASSAFAKRRRTSPASQSTRPSSSWNSEEDTDVGPPALMFKPTRPPGVQLSPEDRHTPLDLFKMFFSTDAVKTLCRNTNRRAAMHVAEGKKYKWTDVCVEEFYKYIGLVFYMAMVKLDHITDYWRQNTFFSQILPPKVMSRDRYRTISWNVHMSDPDADPANDQKLGTPQHDRLFRLKPLMTTIQDACKAFYQPRRSLAVDERMVATKAKTRMTQYMKAKPTKCGFKLFVLVDCSNGYTVDFSVFTGKDDFRSGQGLSYDSVMSLLNRRYLGCGYHVYMNNFHTSVKLLTDLFSQSVGACGTYRDNRKGCPRPPSNAMSEESARGTFRWIRDGPTVFVKWTDAREVSVCSTIHSAYKGDEVQRRVKSRGGTWTTKTFPCPSPVVEYNSHMGGVDLSDKLIQYYSAQHKNMKWYRKLFLHFLDIAATNAYILHKELSASVRQKPMSHKDFMEELIVQLCGCTRKYPRQRHSEHVPVPVNPVNPDVGKVASYGRRTCILCREDGKRQNTPWKCQACDVPLCLQLTRNCFQEWHKKL